METGFSRVLRGARAWGFVFSLWEWKAGAAEPPLLSPVPEAVRNLSLDFRKFPPGLDDSA